jgi:hypothetical protein
MRSTTALLMLAVFGVATAGCSLFLTKGPQLEVQPPPPCTSSVAAPVVDTVLAAASLGLVVVGAEEANKPPQSSIISPTAAGLTGIIVGLVLSTTFISSAGVGYTRTAACRASLEAKPQEPASPGAPQSSLLLVPPHGCPPPGDVPRLCSSTAPWGPSAVVIGDVTSRRAAP